MDEKPNCSYSTEPTTQKQKDELASQKDHTTISETKSTELKTQTVLVKEHPINSDDQTTVPKIQPIYTVDQPSDLKDQPPIQKDETAPHIHILTTKQESTLPDEKVTVIIKRINSSMAIQQSSSSLTVFQADAAKDESVSSEEEIFIPKNYVDSGKGESSTSKRQTAAEVHLNMEKDESCYSGEQAKVKRYQFASSIGESSAHKKVVVASKGNYSGRKSPLNVESKFLLCAEKPASATLSFGTNNCYYVSSNAPLKIISCTQSPTSTQPVPQLPASVAVGTQPPSLFLQALSKLDDSSLTLSVVSHFGVQASPNMSNVYNVESGDITPPDSLTSAPPTFSFVLRQMAARRRPKYMGTFIPSPSFVQQTPPPTYTGAYDVYIEPSLPPPQSRVYTYGFTSMLIVCPECGYTGMTAVTSHVTFCTHLCAFILCLLCCWACAPLPYILRSCKDVYHYCRNCRSFLGMYCPTSPDNVYPNV